MNVSQEARTMIDAIVKALKYNSSLTTNKLSMIYLTFAAIRLNNTEFPKSVEDFDKFQYKSEAISFARTKADAVCGGTITNGLLSRRFVSFFTPENISNMSNFFNETSNCFIRNINSINEIILQTFKEKYNLSKNDKNQLEKYAYDKERPYYFLAYSWYQAVCTYQKFGEHQPTLLIVPDIESIIIPNTSTPIKWKNSYINGTPISNIKQYLEDFSNMENRNDLKMIVYSLFNIKKKDDTGKSDAILIREYEGINESQQEIKELVLYRIRTILSTEKKFKTICTNCITNDDIVPVIKRLNDVRNCSKIS